MRQIYHIQTREIYLKSNFPSQFSDIKCLVPQCSGRDENLHIFSCTYLSPQNQVMPESSFVTYHDIFSNNTDLQQIVAKIIFSRLEVRKAYIGPRWFKNKKGLQIDPRQSLNKSVNLGIKGTRKGKRKTKQYQTTKKMTPKQL